MTPTDDPAPAAGPPAPAPVRRLRGRRWTRGCPTTRPEQVLTHARPMSDEQLLEARVEWLPRAPRCAECGHRGGLVTITDHRHTRRVRRICLKQPCGFTDSNWTACPSFERR